MQGLLIETLQGWHLDKCTSARGACTDTALGPLGTASGARAGTALDCFPAPKRGSRRGAALRRCVLQLSVLGYVLMPIFSLQSWPLVLLYAAAVMAVTAAETVSQPIASYKVTRPCSTALPQISLHARPCTSLLGVSTSIVLRNI
jgi:hypothetical protein